MDLSMLIQNGALIIGLICLGMLAIAFVRFGKGKLLTKDTGGIFAIMFILVIAFVAISVNWK